MSDLLKSLADLPEISFIENDTIEAMMQRLVANYEKAYKEATGQSISLAAASRERIRLYAVALELYQVEQYVDRAGKQNTLKYSYGGFLDNFAAGRSVIRLQPSAARTTLRFTLSEAKEYAVGIPAGIRVTNGAGIYFITEEYAEVPIGGTFVDVDAVCTVEGKAGDGFLVGQINVLVDPLPYVESVANITKTEGGADTENDTSLAERVYLAPSGYSTAGPEDGYTYWVKTFNTDIGSITPVSDQAAGTVTIYILMKDGSLPGEEMIAGLQEFLRGNRKIRPMTDLVIVSAPEVKPLDVDLTYYIDRSNQSMATTIQDKVEAAVDRYIAWQTSEIGRDIDPSELIHLVREAGAKNPVVTSPAFTKVAGTEVAQLGTRTVAYGGLEDD